MAHPPWWPAALRRAFVHQGSPLPAVGRYGDDHDLVLAMTQHVPAACPAQHLGHGRVAEGAGGGMRRPETSARGVPRNRPSLDLAQHVLAPILPPPAAGGLRCGTHRFAGGIGLRWPWVRAVAPGSRPSWRAWATASARLATWNLR